MKGRVGRRLLYVATLTVVWLMLWDRITVANAVSGVAVAVLVLVVFPTARLIRQARPPAFRPFAALRLASYVAGQLVVSNWLVAREILSRRSHISTGIVACPLHTESAGLITLLANIVALSPGTMTVDVRAEPPTLYVHVLMLRDVGAAKGEVARLEQLILRAFASQPDRTDPAVAS
jgi:multicomponent Na+:H+ antiporter subunit E